VVIFERKKKKFIISIFLSGVAFERERKEEKSTSLFPKEKGRPEQKFLKLARWGKKEIKLLSFFLKRPLHHHHHHRPSISSRTIIDDQPKRLLSMREQDAGNLSSNICAREYLVECPNIISRVDREREREREITGTGEIRYLLSLSSLCFLAIVFSLEALSSRLV
jgi:hypothetical protein